MSVWRDLLYFAWPGRSLWRGELKLKSEGQEVSHAKKWESELGKEYHMQSPRGEKQLWIFFLKSRRKRQSLWLG